MKPIEEQITIVDDTVNFYGKNPGMLRAVEAEDKDRCYYEIGTKRCAIGRLMSDAEIKYLRESGNINSQISSIWCSVTSEKIRKFDVKFWNAVQVIHDLSSHWNEASGLSKSGVRYVTQLKKDISEGKYL